MTLRGSNASKTVRRRFWAFPGKWKGCAIGSTRGVIGCRAQGRVWRRDGSPCGSYPPYHLTATDTTVLQAHDTPPAQARRGVEHPNTSSCASQSSWPLSGPRRSPGSSVSRLRDRCDRSQAGSSVRARPLIGRDSDHVPQLQAEPPCIGSLCGILGVGESTATLCVSYRVSWCRQLLFWDDHFLMPEARLC